MSEQQQFWAGEFGDKYTKRNQVDWRARVPFWREIASFAHIQSAHEVGCNAGWNLMALRECDPEMELTGNDINLSAIHMANENKLDVWGGGPIKPSDLIYTCGVLIHVGPNELEAMMKSIIAASRRYVLAVEYEDRKEVEVEYRGHAGKLWRRPFGKLYQDLGLRTVWTERQVPGFDNCTAWLLEK